MVAKDRLVGRQDINGQVGSEGRLWSGEALLRFLLAAVDDVIVTLDRDLRFTGFFGRRAEMYGGVIAGRFLGKTISEVFGEESRVHEEACARALSGQSTVYEFPVAGPHRKYHYETSLAPILDSTGSVAGVIGIARDITARKLADEERQQLCVREQELRSEAVAANRAKDEFLATLSHELRTPLNSMLGWARLLRKGKLDSATAERAFEIIERNARSQAQLMEDLLDISSIISGKLRIDVSPVEVTSTIESALDMLRPAAAAKGVQLQALIHPGKIWVAGDGNRLQQVFGNLLSNALKFTPMGGSIEVEVECQECQVKVAIRDTGEGIDPAFLPYVFDRFRQADPFGGRARGGLGLGLGIVHRLVDLHGGATKAESPGRGRGSTFTVWLPVLSGSDASI